MQIPAIAGAEIGPGIGIGRQTMMDMDGGKPAIQWQTAQDMGQDDRIAAAGQGEAKALLRRQAGGEKGADPLDQIS